MIFEGKVRRLGERVVRLGDELAHVDMVRTSRGWLRVGAMPEIAKLLVLAKTPPHYVVVLPGEVTEVGDGITGEEFIFWSSINAAKFAGTYIGTEAALRTLHAYLEPAVSYYLNEELTSITRRDWLDTLYCPHPIGVDNVARFGPLEIGLEGERVQVRDGGRLLYDDRQTVPIGIPSRVQAVLDSVPRSQETIGRLDVLVVGSGNGHLGNASSFILRYGDRRVWVDPSARPHETLAAHGVHWDDVTDVLVTHIHEDHCAGLTACLAHARRRGNGLRLLTTRPSLEALQRRFGDRIPDLASQLEFQEIEPGRGAQVGEAEFEFRLNHHNLPSGALGFKVRFNGRCLGISGDTKYDEEIIRRLGRPELRAEWFGDCHLVFHEVDLVRPRSVHSYYVEVEKLARQIPGRLLVYHTLGNTHPLEMAQEGKRYTV